MNGAFAGKLILNKNLKPASARTLSAINDDLFSTFTNKGASGALEMQLPAAVKGLGFGFRVDTAQALRMQPASGEVVSLGTGAAGVADKYLGSSTVGCTILLICRVDGVWAVEDVIGTWAQES